MSQHISENLGDPSALQQVPRVESRFRRMLVLGVLGLSAYAVVLAATVPARLVARRMHLLAAPVIDVSGTLWNGRAILAGGYEASWKFAPWESLGHIALVVDWSLRGADTLLEGAASVQPGKVVSTMEGRAGWGLVRLAVPDLSVSCDVTATVSLLRVVFSRTLQGAEGTVSSAEGTCADLGAAAAEQIEVPPLTLTATIEGAISKALVVAEADPSEPWADVVVANRSLGVTVYPPAAQIFKSPPASEPVTLQFPF